MDMFIEFCKRYVSVFTLLQTLVAAASLVVAVIAVHFAIKAIQETRELATKKALQIHGGLIDTKQGMTFQAWICNTGYTAVNIRRIQIVTDEMEPLALGVKENFKRSFLEPQRAIGCDILLENYKPEDKPESFRVEVFDVEDNIYVQEFDWAMG